LIRPEGGQESDHCEAVYLDPFLVISISSSIPCLWWLVDSIPRTRRSSRKKGKFHFSRIQDLRPSGAFKNVVFVMPCSSEAFVTSVECMGEETRPSGVCCLSAVVAEVAAQASERYRVVRSNPASAWHRHKAEHNITSHLPSILEYFDRCHISDRFMAYLPLGLRSRST
jgi:hypothetical protein